MQNENSTLFSTLLSPILAVLVTKSLPFRNFLIERPREQKQDCWTYFCEESTVLGEACAIIEALRRLIRLATVTYCLHDVIGRFYYFCTLKNCTKFIAFVTFHILYHISVKRSGKKFVGIGIRTLSYSWLQFAGLWISLEMFIVAHIYMKIHRAHINKFQPYFKKLHMYTFYV